MEQCKFPEKCPWVFRVKLISDRKLNFPYILEMHAEI
jgi:hypothetical protein